jgi:hypothetical protein
MDKQTLTAIIEAHEATGANLAGLKAAHGENKIKRWRRKYAVINNETGEKGVVDKANNTLKLSCVETVFTDLLSVHNNDGHRYPHSESDKALEKRFLEKVVNKYIKIPKRVVELFVATCPGCNIKMSREIMHSLEDQNRQLLEGTSSSNEVPIAGSADATVVAAADADSSKNNNDNLITLGSPSGRSEYDILYYRTLVDQLQEELAAMNEENERYRGIIKKRDEENKLLRPRLDIDTGSVSSRDAVESSPGRMIVLNSKRRGPAGDSSSAKGAGQGERESAAGSVVGLGSRDNDHAPHSHNLRSTDYSCVEDDDKLLEEDYDTDYNVNLPTQDRETKPDPPTDDHPAVKPQSILEKSRRSSHRSSLDLDPPLTMSAFISHINVRTRQLEEIWEQALGLSPNERSSRESKLMVGILQVIDREMTSVQVELQSASVELRKKGKDKQESLDLVDEEDEQSVMDLENESDGVVSLEDEVVLMEQLFGLYESNLLSSTPSSVQEGPIQDDDGGDYGDVITADAENDKQGNCIDGRDRFHLTPPPNENNDEEDDGVNNDDDEEDDDDNSSPSDSSESDTDEKVPKLWPNNQVSI